MSRYSNSGSQSGSNDNNYDDITLKLQKFAAIRVDGDRVNAFDSQYGDKFIAGFDNAAVIDGIVFQRDDKPGTWKVFSAGKFFNLNPEDGLVYEQYDAADDTYSGEMTASDILNHPRVAGFSETFGGDDYFYQPVGVVIEEADDIALNDDIVGNDATGYLTEDEAEQARDDLAIPMGEVSMLLSNKSWTRTLAKKMTQTGDAIIEDDGTSRDEGNPKYESHGWLTEMDPELRTELEGRTLELWVTEEPVPGQEDEDDPDTYTTPNLLDVKTGNFVTIDNGIANPDDDGDSGGDSQQTNHEQGTQEAEAAEADDAPAADPEPEADTSGGESEVAADGGLPDTLTDKSDLPGDIPEVLWDLIGYFARTEGDATPEEIRDFSEDEVDDPDAVDWEMAAEAVPKHPKA